MLQIYVSVFLGFLYVVDVLNGIQKYIITKLSLLQAFSIKS